ncbi:MAG: hypothetical protein NVSMB46_04740 [Candidatus Saccharimonadales bacterium]
MIHLMSRKKLILSLALGGIFIILSSSYYVLKQYKNSHNSDFGSSGCEINTVVCNRNKTYSADVPKYQELEGYYLEGTGFYSCSKKIKLVSNTKNQKGEYIHYLPVNESEANLFCHLTTAEEFKGKIKVLQKDEVLKLISKYQYKDVSIKALEFKYIKDKEYVHRLLPQYIDREIGCIIVLQTPGESKVYIEDEQLNTFTELDYQVFTHNLEQVSLPDRQLFYDNLK